MKALVTIAILALAACSHQGEAMSCQSVAEPLIIVPVERQDSDLIWRDSNGIGHRITERDSSEWRCGSADQFL